LVKINFIFTIHFHQPIGQLKWVNERVYENSYKLLLDIFKKYADLKFTIHISGPLLMYLRDTFPDWIEEIAKLGDYGTFEFLAGSLGEAILPLLPVEDRLYQVKEYLRFFENIFGFKPKGLWLPERVWEPSLPEPLVRNGIEYVLIDDSTLYRSGRSEPDNYYVWLTEDSGYKLKIFFIDTGLRYVLPWRSSEEVFNYMLSKGSDTSERVIVWGSDAEKFGEWRDREWAVWWLNDFLSKIRVRRDIRMVHPSEYIREYGVKGLLYLPSGSYDKMLEWSSGFFRNFLVKYRESNNMHKKMLWVRKKLLKMPYRDEDAWRHYYLAQCNDPYWHGLFGGIYLSHLRQAVYENYIVAERMAEESIDYYSGEEVLIKTIDFDYDGFNEYLIETPNINLYLKPSDGGTLFEYDVKIKGMEHNIQDTMTRYYESYLENTGFNPDWYRRVSLRIHLWSLDTSLNDWINNTPFKDKSDLATKNYKTIVTSDKKLIMRTIGGYYDGVKRVDVFVEKKLEVLKTGYSVEYTIKNIGGEAIKTKLGIEYHIAPKIDRENKDTSINYITDHKRDIKEKWKGYVDKIVIKTPIYKDIALEQRGFDDIWVSPLNSLARTEKGLKEIFQGIAVMFIKNIVLEPNKEYVFNVKHYIII